MIYFAHGGEEAQVTPDTGLLDVLTHQPVWISLIIIAFVLFGIYALLEKLKVKPLNRLMALIPLLILIAILYLEHNPAVTTVVLSVGFIASFFLAFTLLTSSKKVQDKNDVSKNPKPKL